MPAKRKKKSKKPIVITLGVLGLAAVAWRVAVGLSTEPEFTSTLPQELRLETLQSQAQSQNPGELFAKIRETMQREDLTEEQRREFRDNMRRMRESMMDDHVDEYYAAAEDKRPEVLDRHLDELQERMSQWRAERERRRREREAEGDRTEEQRRRWRGGFRNMSRTERKSRSESRDPDRMARRMAYRRALMDRARERGIDLPFGRGRGPGGRGRP
jgi:hypothetical protein